MVATDIIATIGLVVEVLLAFVILPMRSDIKELNRDNKAMPKDYVSKEDYQTDRQEQRAVNAELYKRVTATEKECAANHRETNRC